MNRFAIDESKLAAWLDTQLSGASELDIDPTWNPQAYGQETTVYDLIRKAHGQVILPPDGIGVAFCYCDDSDGGGYCWLVDIAAAQPHDLRLASAFQEMRWLVTDEQVGREAAESILREAVEQANGCLTALARHTAPRGTEEIDAVIGETRLKHSVTPEPDDPGCQAGVADGLARDPVTSPIATVGELIAALEAFDDDTPVRLAFQPSWPFEHCCGQVAADSGGTVWIAEGAQIGYLPGLARQALGW
jgi:hypothetical protein